MMNEDKRHIKIITYLFSTMTALSLSFLSLNVYNYVGSLNALNKIDISVTNIVMNPVGNETRITLIFLLINPTTYSNLKFSSLQCRLFLNFNGGEEYLGWINYSSLLNESLKPKKQISISTTISIPKSKSQFFLNYGLNSKIKLRIKGVIYLVTPIMKYYKSIDIITMNLSDYIF